MPVDLIDESRFEDNISFLVPHIARKITFPVGTDEAETDRLSEPSRDLHLLSGQVTIANGCVCPRPGLPGKGWSVFMLRAANVTRFGRYGLQVRSLWGRRNRTDERPSPLGSSHRRILHDQPTRTATQGRSCGGIAPRSCQSATKSLLVDTLSGISANNVLLRDSSSCRAPTLRPRKSPRPHPPVRHPLRSFSKAAYHVRRG